MLEWLKRHAWKACIRQNRISGSNPDLSATKKRLHSFGMRLFCTSGFKLACKAGGAEKP